MNRQLKQGEVYLMLLKMTQTVKETLHHHRDLDKAHITAEVRNMTQTSDFCVPIQKRLFFNKENYPLGAMYFRVGDKIRIQFGITRFTSEGTEFEAFAINDYKVTNKGLVREGEEETEDPQLKQQFAKLQAETAGTADEPYTNRVDLLTWRAQNMIVPFEFSKESQYLNTFKTKNADKKKRKPNSLRIDAERDDMI